ncbi:hypothetical protein FA048_15100 [Pedobacter polaris]|uniref:Uncharacterized protein n=1 Tax=Pedobacter polaris TaxID=2571273 RepID=A0A4U1CI53_9SPHI|nr:hypothetical protein [Pedobacter polaris]TKC06537.1 hypothetical protein FA048_15100 [Pedobacter polaris]
MERVLELKSVLLDNYTINEVERFLSYQLTVQERNLILETLEAALINVPNKAFACTQISAAWAAMIQDHSRIPVAVVCGDLAYRDTKLFVCHSPIPILTTDEIFIQEWDGHCWLELGGMIADASIFRTIYQGRVSKTIKNQIIEQFGEGKGALIATPEQMSINNFTYSPKYTLNDIQINGILRGLLQG